MTATKALTIDQLDTLCAALPGATRSIKWEVDLVWSVGGKMFVVYCTLGPERGRLSFKVDTDRFLELSDQPGMMAAPYMARAFWICVSEPERYASRTLAEHVRHSYTLVRSRLSKRMQASLPDA
ncbi:MmcQ/YjbR family DNA-binding protein [Dokdonella koreensis]|uniref:MmcQ/YjbR family DNA-binding protein n=1 Tax=Dokdonella koreensis DS-123 TaxID=1300342 RepID=A0A160DVK3_9GAMM|nr:MmcQ/YjbR family DNA-binding protein [Dokdonella koreensis]ANB18588.1 Hypothetical protein I596_2586 [Dokdonella koreensis DS-123]